MVGSSNVVVAAIAAADVPAAVVAFVDSCFASGYGGLAVDGGRFVGVRVVGTSETVAGRFVVALDAAGWSIIRAQWLINRFRHLNVSNTCCCGGYPF